MADKLRWALLSTANINRALIDPLKRAARSELSAVASRDLAKARAYAIEKGIPRAFGSYEEMLADPDIDAVYISLPNGMHAEWTIKAAQAGKHVLCEKPLVINMQEMDAVEKAASENGVTVFEAFMYLHHPQTLKVKELIDEGRIGKLQTIEAQFNFYLRPENSTNVRLQTGLEGGSIWDVGVYPNSYAIAVTGGKAPEAVWAQNLTGETGVDVGGRAQYRFANDVTAQVSTGFRTPFREGASFVGDAGIIHVPQPWKPGIEGNHKGIFVTGRDGKTENILIPETNPYDCEVAAMEACVFDGAAPVVPLSLSREFLKTILAWYESGKTQEVVKP